MAGALDGKVAIVTGAGRGIGRCEALALSSEGAKVVVNDLGGDFAGEGKDDRPAQQVVDEITGGGGEAVANHASVADWSGAEGLVDQAVDAFGRLDILVNNAGILRDKMSFNMSESDWDAVINVHLKGHFCPSRHAAAYWRARSKESGEPVNAKVVNTASESGLYGNAGQLNYAAAKAGIAAMAIVLARELERFGVRVNAIAPVARTRMTENLSSAFAKPEEGKLDQFDPENVAAAVTWLASDRSAPLTGHVVKVQGGLAQIVQGWHPVTQVKSAEPWSFGSFDKASSELLKGVEPGVPPFYFDVG